METRIIYHHTRHYQEVKGKHVISPNGGSTYAIEVDKIGNVVAFAVAHCNPKDNFNKHYGRVKAEGRLKSSIYRREMKAKIPYKQFIDTLVE